MRPVPARPPTVRTRAIRHSLLAVLMVLLAGAWFGGPATVSATSTSATMDAQVLASINTDRVALGLHALRLDSRLVGWSADRSAWMAARGVMTHTSYDGSPCNLYNVMRITWYGCGEAVAYTTATPGAAAAAALYALWKGSPDHYALITSKTFNYIGIGITYQPVDRTTYASILFLEGPDRSLPIASLTNVSLTDRTVHWGWTAGDPILQTHTAGVKNYDIELRANNGSWRMLRANSVTLSYTLQNRLPGSSWALRVRARDNAGNVSGWVTSATIVVH
jgi:uncharacterized protein YkwD